MKLYLVRHGSAEEQARIDAERPLTKEGREEARRVGLLLTTLGATPERIFASPLLRAKQTAAQIATQLKSPPRIQELPQLENGHPLPALLAALGPAREEAEFVLVGHAPSLPEHLAELLGGPSVGSLSFGKGTVACVEFGASASDRRRLVWLLRQKQLRDLLDQ